ncbi:MAG: hypothetical protein EZS28_016878 [Streblomastix strix]|uniref:Uncharacterized protein n=1 Tax=Streblomastix strix TaxID=222440 RepID=A0A5J4VYE5_9EUKA|nr:MAG: hypothetical protein EZS28_016878 [Streblomastix strix]
MLGPENMAWTIFGFQAYFDFLGSTSNELSVHSKNSNSNISNSPSLHKQKQNPKAHISKVSKAPFTGHLADREAPEIDFSLISSDAPELQGVVWGPSGPPATLSLAKFGVFVPTPEIIYLQRRQSMVDDQIDYSIDEQDQNDLEHKQKEQQLEENDKGIIYKKKLRQKQDIFPHQILTPVEEDIE